MHSKIYQINTLMIVEVEVTDFKDKPAPLQVTFQDFQTIEVHFQQLNNSITFKTTLVAHAYILLSIYP